MSADPGTTDASRASLLPPNDGILDTGATADREASHVRFVLLTIAIAVACCAFASIHPWGSTTAYMATFLLTGVIVHYIAARRDALLFRFLVVAALAGWLELLTDWYIIKVVPSLVYPLDGPFVASSPLYMPIAWTIVLWQLGCLARWIDRRWGLVAATISGFIFGGVNIPFYEYVAERAGWWHYENVPGIGNAPFYVITAEALIVAALPLIYRIVEKRRLPAAVGAGVALGAWIFVAAWIGLALFG